MLRAIQLLHLGFFQQCVSVWSGDRGPRRPEERGLFPLIQESGWKADTGKAVWKKLIIAKFER